MNANRNGINLIGSVVAILAAALFSPAGVEAHCGGNHIGNHPHCSAGEPPPPTASSCPGDFPAFAYAVKRVDKRGRTVGSDLRLSNADGSCQVLIHSESSTRRYDYLTFSFDSVPGIYRIAYKYEWDEADTRETGFRPNVRVMQFTASTADGITTIADALPLQAHKVYRYSGNSSAGRGILGTDLIGASLVFSEEHGFEVGTQGDPRTDWYASIKIIEDVGACIATYGPEPDDHCAAAAFEPSVNQRATLPTWGLDTKRILFTYDASSPRDSDVALAVIDREGVGLPWSAPGLAWRYGELQYTDSYAVHHGFPAVWEDASGPRTVVNSRFDGTLRILHLTDSCTAVNSMVESCLTLGLASAIGPAYDAPPRGDWFTMNTTIDAGPNLIFIDWTTHSIGEFDPHSRTEVSIIDNVQNLTWLAPVKAR